MHRIACSLLLTLCCGLGFAQSWHHPLYLSGGGLWRQRIALDVRNDTDQPFAGQEASVRIGTGRGEANLVGQPAEALRLVNTAGVEMLYGVVGPNQEPVKAGPIPAGSLLSIPVEAAPRQTVRYWLYFDNPQAWRVPDHLDTTTGLKNGGVELGAGEVPSGWVHDANDEQHRTLWVKERPHAGDYCLKTVVSDGAEPTWIATRQSNVRIVGGAKYVFSGWVRARDLKGVAGWYIHVGNAQNSMLVSPMPTISQTTNEWTEVRTEFTAPREANRADLGTVLRGTGTAWFDDVSLQTDATTLVTAVASAPERLQAAEIGQNAPLARMPWDYRAPVRVFNFEAAPRSTIVAVDCGALFKRLGARASNVSVAFQGRVIPHSRLKDTLLFAADLPARSICTYYLCATGGPAPAQGDDRAQYQTLLLSSRNLIKNGDFELGETEPTDWPYGAEGQKTTVARLGFDTPGLFGKRCARMEVPAGTPKNWIGWRQDVRVTPGRSYLYAAWLKCANLDGGLQLHAHRRDAQGEICKVGGFTGAGPAITGTTDWTLLSGLFDTPEDCAIFQVHLTMNATGTAWHDGAVLAEVTPGEVGTLEGKAPTALTMWPVNAVVKVFQEDVPPTALPAARITAAREEYEPLQVAVRSPQALPGVRVSVDPAVSNRGGRLPVPEIGVVGYVPIDHSSSYFGDKSPEYYRRLPRGEGGSDGFAGLWPDPILPRDSFDLAAGKTQPLWLTFRIPADALPGDYRGTVRLLSGARQIAELPYTVHVWDFALPAQSHLKAIYDVRQNTSIWQRPGVSGRQVREEFWRFMAQRRVCPDRVQPDPVLRYENGRVIANFEEYDKACRLYFDELKFPHSYTPGIFYCFGWGYPPYAKFGEQPYAGEYPFEGVDRGKLRPEYKRAYQACLKAYWDHMKQKGWADKITLYLSDEPYNNMPEVIAQMKAICDMIHEVDPQLPIYVSNWTPQPLWEGYVTVWGAGQYGGFPVADMQRVQRRGDTVWITTDGQMCTDTPYLACERLLPHYAAKYGAKAYEFWGIDWLTYNPWEYGWHSFIMQSGRPDEKPSGTRYPNGDGYLAYPGGPVGVKGAVTSLRLEQAREGVEDYEYLYLLQQAKATKTGNATVRAALAQAEALIEIPNAGGRYSTKILPQPDAVFAVKEALGRAVETLKNR